jgi:hypothetical protein
MASQRLAVLRKSPPFIPSTSEAFSKEYESPERTSDLVEPEEPEPEPVADEDSYAQYDETRDDEYEEYEGDLSDNDDSESGDEEGDDGVEVEEAEEEEEEEEV